MQFELVNRLFFLIVIIVCSVIALALNLTSIFSTRWIVSSATNDLARKPSSINYGLFWGHLENYLIAQPYKYDLTVTCNYGEGKCMYSCHQTMDQRQDELLRIIKGETLLECTRLVDDIQLKMGRDGEITAEDDENGEKPDKDIFYIGSGYWVCTVMFLIISTLLMTACLCIIIVNIFWSPVEPILNIFGLYVWNAASAVCILLALIIYGSLYATTLWYNVAVTDTLRPQSRYDSTGLSALGYSYFILLPTIFFNILIICLTFVRERLLSKVPPPVVIDRGDDIMLSFY